MRNRWAAVAIAGVFGAGLSGCGGLSDGDFVTRCAGNNMARGFDAETTREVFVGVPGSYNTEAVHATEDVVKEIDLPASDGLVVDFLLGTDLDSNVDMSNCFDAGIPAPGLERPIHATAGHATIVLHPAVHERSFHADVRLTDVTFTDAAGTVTVTGFVMDNAFICNCS